MQLVQTPSDSLRRHLDSCAVHDAEFNRGLSDHLPMLLHALHALGAPAERLGSYASMYTPRLEPRQKSAVACGDWLALRGRMDTFDALVGFFVERIKVRGRDAVLREALPQLMPGVAAGAFHGLIRCGHAIAAEHDGELANGLAYWTAAWLPMLPVGDGSDASILPPPSLNLADWIMSVPQLTTTLDIEQPRITLRMKAWSAAPQFQALATALRVDDETLETIARFAATLYAQTGNFTVMHMVTSAHALLTLRPWLDDVKLATRWFGAAALAAFRAVRLSPTQLAAGLTALDRPEAIAAMPVLPWEEIAYAAIASDDDHAAKIVYSCRALHEMFGALVFHAAATQGMLTQTRTA